MNLAELDSRAVKARDRNEKTLRAYKQRQQLLSRKRREHYEDELQRLEAEERGEDYDRQRAWDYTLEESLEWDAKMRDKSRRVQVAQGLDPAQLAEKTYYKELSRAHKSQDPVQNLIEQVSEHRSNQRDRKATTSYINDANARFNIRLDRVSK